MSNKFKFSVIIPIYNVENFLEDTIKSVIKQTLNFKKYIQIILVNDGSTDGCEQICKKYVKLYPKNIIYIKQKNLGVSAARNLGLKYAEGEYINFLDSDDIWQKGVFKKALKMFERNPEIPMIGVKQKFFEATNGYTPLNYKFEKGTRIVDITKEFDSIQLSISSAFVRKEYIKDLKFDTKIKYSEDAKFIYELLMKNNKTKYGLLAEPIYLYRKRYSQNSAIQSKSKDLDWYFVTTQLSYKYLLDKAYEENPQYVRTIAYYIMYDYQWRIKEKIEKILNAEEQKKYIELTKELFVKIPDEVILAQKQIDDVYKNILLNFKYNNDYNKVNNILNQTQHNSIVIDIFECRNDVLIIEGYFNRLKQNKVEFGLKVNNEIKKMELFDRIYPANKNFIESNCNLTGFKIELPIKQVSDIEFYNKQTQDIILLRFGNLTKLYNKKHAYYKYTDNIITASDKTIKIIHNQTNIIKNLVREIKFLINIKSIKCLIIRIIFDLLPKSKKKIWIFSDRQAIAGDNAEELFKYVNEQKNKNIKTYFVIDKKSKDIPRLKKYGKIIYYRTMKYRLLFLKSDLIISSHSEKYTINCFGKSIMYFKDLLKFKYVFLQHGIIRNNLSEWLQKYNKNIALFITTTEEERNSIVNTYPYSYNDSVVKLTGLPRYDKLLNNVLHEENKILLLPTWRAYLAGDRVNGNSQKRLYNPNFKESYFFNTYNSLINDKSVIKVLKKYHYKIKFCLHPSLRAQAKDFKGNEYVEVCEENIDYQYEFKTSKLLITDYSSVSCDFAYLKKPVIYIEGDKEEFYKNHIYEEGFFDEEKNGFGPVCYNYETLINVLIKMIENNCKLEEKYENNIKKFFKYRDSENCKRVYDEMLNLCDR